MIRAIGNEPTAPIINGDDVDWAHNLVSHCHSALLKGADTYIAENEIEQNKKRVLEIINTSGRISRDDLRKRTYWLKARDRAEVLNEIEDMITVVEVHEGSRGPKTKYYCRKAK